ncbi:MAG: cytochrome c oxidase subunit II [Gemmatimonadaceae bacterium]
MPKLQLRRLQSVAVPAIVLLALSACGRVYPNSTFSHNTDLNTLAVFLWDRMLLLGTIVFVVVEVLLVYTIFKFRRREGGPAPRQIHGNAALEITWTAIPALILVFLAVPTVRTIFQTQRKAPDNSVQIEVIGHQWWWEFRYPQYGIVTANEVYLPIGKTASFSLRTRDVLHSFWIPQMGGKRDLISNHTNYLWFTPNADLTSEAYNGACAEYCGASHANMRFRAFTVTPAEFDKWVAHQQTLAVGSPAAAAALAAADSANGAKGAKATPVKMAAMPGMAAVTPAASAAPEVWVYPLEKMKAFTLPSTPLPATPFDDALLAAGDVKAGREIVTNLAKAPCLTCHNIKGEAQYITDDQAKGPNLTHIGTRHTFAAGLFRTEPRALALWIKNAPMMKPGTVMPTFGTGEFNPFIKQKVTAGGLDDKQIADVVAYLMSLK